MASKSLGREYTCDECGDKSHSNGGLPDGFTRVDSRLDRGNMYATLSFEVCSKCISIDHFTPKSNPVPLKRNIFISLINKAKQIRFREETF